MSGPLASVVIASWPLLVLAAGWRWRPRRLPFLDPSIEAGSDAAATASSARPARPPWDVLVGGFEPMGRALRRADRRPPDRQADRNAGMGVAATALLAPFAPPLSVLVATTWWVIPWVHRRRSIRAGEAAVRSELPLVADLFLLAAGAGLTVPLAVAAVARRSTGPVGVALGEAERRTRLGQHPADAVEAVVEDVGEAVRPLVSVLTAAERYGTPLVGPLEHVAEDFRRQRRRHAEEAARRVPVKLLFPLVMCTLPAFALLTVVPLLVSALGGLRT